MRRTGSLIVLSFCLALSLTSGASAQYTVAWRAPDTCTRAAFDAELARLLAGTDHDFSASVALSQRASAWSTTVAIGSATRTLSLASCAEAQRTAALLIATAIAPERVTSSRNVSVATGLAPTGASATDAAAASATPASEPPTEPAVEPPPPPPPAPPPPTPPAERKPRVPAPRIDSNLRLRLGGLLAVETLPAPSGGPSLGLELVRGHVVSWVDARYLVARRAIDGNSSLRADLDLFAAALGAAWLWEAGPLAFGPLLELEAGALRARGQGERDATDGRAGWLAGALGVRVDAHLYRRAAASLYAAASVPFWRPGVQLGDERAFHTTPPLGFRLGIVLRLAIGSTKAENAGQ